MILSRVLHYLSFLTASALLTVLFITVDDMYDKSKVYPEHVHVTIYLQRDFDDFEQEKIISAAYKWSVATDYRVEYDIVQLPTKEKMQKENVLYFVKISPDHPSIIVMDSLKKATTLAYYDDQYGPPTISLVTDRMLDDRYEEIVMHELGHSLGIDHLDGLENMDTLMFPYTNIIVDGGSIPAGSDHITPKDIEAFCKIHHCSLNN